MGHANIKAKWVALIITILGAVWGASAAFTTLQTGQEQLQEQFEEHLLHKDEVVAELKSIKAVLDQHLKWDTLYVNSQGHLDAMQQRDIVELKEDIEELKKR